MTGLSSLPKARRNRKNLDKTFPDASFTKAVKHNFCLNAKFLEFREILYLGHEEND